MCQTGSVSQPNQENGRSVKEKMNSNINVM